MSVRKAILAVLLATFGSAAMANHCPMDMKEIDDALASKPQLSAQELEQVKKYRAEGEALHKAGKHQESVEALGKAKAILGI